MGQETNYERYKTEIYRIGWRVQYRAKKIRKRECSIFENISTENDFTSSSDNKIIVEELLNALPPKGRSILYKLYMQGFTEAELARDMKISQQAVNKWKRKLLKLLSQKVNS